ncbi:MAG: hypothetical protein ABWX92_01875 [Mycetocola sp.]
MIAIVLPISAFVGGGLRAQRRRHVHHPHELALLKREPTAAAATTATPEQLASLVVVGFANNLLAATVDNVIGGAVLVGLVYWFVYLRDGR